MCKVASFITTHTKSEVKRQFTNLPVSTIHPIEVIFVLLYFRNRLD